MVLGKTLYTIVYICIHGDVLAEETTVRIDRKVKASLDSLKNFKKESYSEVIERLVNSCSDDPLSASEIEQIESSLEDIKKGRVLSMRMAEKKWGV